MHSVTGVWICGLATLMILSGLPWSKFWGSYFDSVRRLAGDAVQRMDWSIGNTSEASAAVVQPPEGSHSLHGHQKDIPSWFSRSTYDPATIDFSAVGRVEETVRPLKLPPPVYVSPPRGSSSAWIVRSMTPNRTRRISMLVDGTTGEITQRESFTDMPLLNRVVGIGIALHEGQLFGWPNQLVGVLYCRRPHPHMLSGALMWWRRRKPAVLGAPAAAMPPRFSFGLLITIVALAVYLPFFGASLLMVLLMEKLLLRRIPAVRAWLGLQLPRYDRQRPVTTRSFNDLRQGITSCLETGTS